MPRPARNPQPTVVFGHARDDHLRVAFGPKRAALQQGLAEVHAARVHVQARVHIVQSVDHHVQIGPEGVVKDVLAVGGDPVLQRAHLQRRIDVLRRRRRHCGLGAARQNKGMCQLGCTLMRLLPVLPSMCRKGKWAKGSMRCTKLRGDQKEAV